MMRNPRPPAYTLLPPVPVSGPQGPRGKPVTRRTVLSRRDALSAEARAAASLAIAVRALEVCETARWVALYAPKGSEVDTAALDRELRARGIKIAYPVVLVDRKQLGFRAAAPDELVPARYGLREPAADAPSVELGELDVIFVPGIAFDRLGGRVGWGRGHYDATLAAAPAARWIGLAFECQVLDRVPAEPHDALLHAVVTEVAIHPRAG